MEVEQPIGYGFHRWPQQAWLHCSSVIYRAHHQLSVNIAHLKEQVTALARVVACVFLSFIGSYFLFFTGQVYGEASMLTPLTDPYPRFVEPSGPLTTQMRLWRVRTGEERIAGKLERKLEYAKQQGVLEQDREFCYQECEPSLRRLFHSQQFSVGPYEVGLCHAQGRRREMEDEHIARSGSVIIGKQEYSFELFAVLDGHGGRAAAEYVRDHLEEVLCRQLKAFCPEQLHDVGIWNALKRTFALLDADFKASRIAGTTATVALLLDHQLWCANVGDSRTILDDGTQLTEDAKPSDPRCRRNIEHWGHGVYYGRIDGVLAVGRAVGDHELMRIDPRTQELKAKVNPRPTITKIANLELLKGRHLVLGCDGIYDVSSTRQIAQAVQEHSQLTLQEQARNISYSAWKAGSADNLSVMIISL